MHGFHSRSGGEAGSPCQRRCTRTRPCNAARRKKDLEEATSQQDRQGVHTFRRGDCVLWTSGKPGERAEAVVLPV